MVTVINFTIGAVSLSGLIYFIFKKAFEYWLKAKETEHKKELDKQLEEFKLKKQSELDLKKEGFKIERTRLLEQSKLRFTKLHEDRAFAIKKLYLTLLSLTEKLNVYLNFAMDREDFIIDGEIKEEYIARLEILEENLKNKFEEFLNISDINLIYFSADTEKVLGNINYSIDLVLKDFESNKIFKRLKITSKEKEAKQEADEILKNAKKLLVLEFREILGVE
ncbi:hypothetical protein [Metaclostridioides mangenotii]|uniref:Uncharacterized protein n=1 Tax=Metaclostridioides mangenotii TaxID=1540 RepID=A0ABS4E9P1_9FIRM|nr:hypothetical protein [Clostridioides mangenotii]MBP1854666.1 hypothetical protein [Clostridioides mangenotii]